MRIQAAMANSMRTKLMRPTRSVLHCLVRYPVSQGACGNPSAVPAPACTLGPLRRSRRARPLVRPPHQSHCATPRRCTRPVVPATVKAPHAVPSLGYTPCVTLPTSPTPTLPQACCPMTTPQPSRRRPQPPMHASTQAAGQAAHTYDMGPSRLPSANWRTMGSSVVSNSLTLPSHTTLPWCRKMMRSTARRMVECWCVTTM